MNRPPNRLILSAMSEKLKRRVSAVVPRRRVTRPDGFTLRREPHRPRRSTAESAVVPALMFGLLGLGIAVILLNYVGSIWDTNNASCCSASA